MPLEPDPDDARRRTHRALANVNRVRLLRLLEDGPREVVDLAEATALHPNTVRAHLDVLVDGGLVERTKRVDGGPGRPPWTYGLPPPPPEPAAQASDRQLAIVLAEALQQVADDPSVVAEAVGRPWGKRAVAGEAEPSGDRQAVERVVELLEQQGFAPELRRGANGRAQVLLRACPYDGLAQRYGEIVCSVHLGLIRGALEGLGASVGADLRPLVEPGLCITELAAAPRAGEGSERP